MPPHDGIFFKLSACAVRAWRFHFSINSSYRDDQTVFHAENNNGAENQTLLLCSTACLCNWPVTIMGQRLSLVNPIPGTHGIYQRRINLIRTGAGKCILEWELTVVGALYRGSIRKGYNGSK
jgi:hypothetical protein